MRVFSFDPEGYRSNHFRGANEMLETIPATPIEPDFVATLEHELGHAVVMGSIDAPEALERLESYSRIVHDLTY